jgi:hypothetical protein
MVSPSSGDLRAKIFATAVVTYFVSRDLWAAYKIFKAKNESSVSILAKRRYSSASYQLNKILLLIQRQLRH